VRSTSAVQLPPPRAHNDRTTENYGNLEKVVHSTYGDEISETPYGLLQKCVDDVTSQRISRKLKSVAQKHRSADYHVQFLPSSKIGKILGKSAVLLELSRHKAIIPEGAEPDEYQKILAVLYLTKMPSVIGAFVTAGVSDAYLPFDETTVAVDGVHRVGLRSRRQSNICCAPFAYPSDTRSFLQQQWSVIAHVFDKAEGNHVPSYHLDRETILPYREHDPTGRKGAYGRIYRTKIHPDHHPWNWNKKEARM
jgi:hypothetical protein